MNPDLDAFMRHRRHHPGWSPTETITAVTAATPAPRKPRRDWLGLLFVLPVAVLSVAIVVGAGAHFTQGGVRVIHQTRVVHQVRTVTVTVTAPGRVRLEAARPQVRTVTAAPRLVLPRNIPVITVTVTASPRPAPTVTVTVTATPTPVATP